MSYQPTFDFDAQQEEIWKDVARFPGYQVSDRGRVRSFWKLGRNGGITESPRILDPKPGLRGYISLCLYRRGKPEKRYAHLLVLETFVGPRPPCPPGSKAVEGCHKDDVPTNNVLSNLYWGTHTENVADSRRNGTFRLVKGEKHPFAKLTDVMVIDIKRRLAKKEPAPSIARIHGIKSGAVFDIKYGRAWSHIVIDELAAKEN